MLMSHDLGALRIIEAVPPPSSAFLTQRLQIMHSVLLRFERLALDHISVLSRPTRLDIQDLMASWRAVRDTPIRTVSGRQIAATLLNDISREYNELERRVDSAIASATPTTEPDPTTKPDPSPAEEAGRRAAEAIATGTARGIGQIVLVGALAVGALAVWWSVRNRNEPSSLSGRFPFDVIEWGGTRPGKRPWYVRSANGSIRLYEDPETASRIARILGKKLGLPLKRVDRSRGF